MGPGLHEEKRLSYKAEILRKIVHIGAIIIPALYYYLEFNKIEMLAVVIPVGIFIFIIDLARIKKWKIWNIFKKSLGPLLRQSERRGGISGATCIFIGVCLAVALYSREIAITVIAYNVIGDPASALIGKRFGYHRYGEKSVEGSIAFFIAASIVAFISWHIFGSVVMPLWIAVAGAFVATLAEGLVVQIDDNITVPVVSGAAMTLFVYLTGNPAG